MEHGCEVSSARWELTEDEGEILRQIHLGLDSAERSGESHLNWTRDELMQRLSRDWKSDAASTSSQLAIAEHRNPCISYLCLRCGRSLFEVPLRDLPPTNP